MKRFKVLFGRLLVIFRFYFRGPVNAARSQGVIVGSGCRLYIWNFGTEPFLISIGDNVTITSGVKLLTHDGATWLVRDSKGRRQKYGRIQIGSNVFIGVNTIILPGIQIGNNCVVAAGSVVTKSIPDNSIFGGNPARFICRFDEYEKKALEKFIPESSLSKFSSYRERVNHAIELAEK